MRPDSAPTSDPGQDPGLPKAPSRQADGLTHLRPQRPDLRKRQPEPRSGHVSGKIKRLEPVRRLLTAPAYHPPTPEPAAASISVAEILASAIRRSLVRVGSA